MANASLRDQLAESVVRAIGALPNWTAHRRDVLTSLVFDGRVAVVNILGESKRPESQLFYECTLRIGIAIIVKREDADPVEHNGNDVRYLDAAIAEVEAAVHAMTWDADVLPVITGHDFEPPAEPNILQAGVQLTVDYKHDFDNPCAYTASFVV